MRGWPLEKVNDPEVGCSNPARIRSRVDLPLPDGPSTHTNSCGWIEKEAEFERMQPAILIRECDTQIMHNQDGLGH